MKATLISNVIFTCCLLAIASSSLSSQASAKLILEENKESSQLCYDVSLKYEGNQKIMIASQNYRFFYSSETLDFDEKSSVLLLPEETYTYRLVQHQNHVDGSSIGKLPFDADLGFINSSVILNNTNSLGAGLDRLAPEIKLIRLCFDHIAGGDKHLLPAREELTKEYGRAYIDVSYVDEEGKINSLNFTTYEDVLKQGK